MILIIVIFFVVYSNLWIYKVFDSYKTRNAAKDPGNFITWLKSHKSLYREFITQVLALAGSSLILIWFAILVLGPIGYIETNTDRTSVTVSPSKTGIYAVHTISEPFVLNQAVDSTYFVSILSDYDVRRFNSPIIGTVIGSENKIITTEFRIRGAKGKCHPIDILTWPLLSNRNRTSLVMMTPNALNKTSGNIIFYKRDLK